jgi:hypothetical protein
MDKGFGIFKFNFGILILGRRCLNEEWVDEGVVEVGSGSTILWMEIRLCVTA